MVRFSQVHYFPSPLPLLFLWRPIRKKVSHVLQREAPA